VYRTRKAIFERLTADAPLAALAPGGVHYGAAPEGTALPFVAFRLISAVPNDRFIGSHETEIWLVKGVAADITGKSGVQISEEIEERIRIVLQDAMLAVTDSILYYCRRERGMPPLTEQHQGRTLYSAGAYYRLEFE
jgi:hypothetical protein